MKTTISFTMLVVLVLGMLYGAIERSTFNIGVTCGFLVFAVIGAVANWFTNISMTITMREMANASNRIQEYKEKIAASGEDPNEGISADDAVELFGDMLPKPPAMYRKRDDDKK